ncbi:MAG: T9SS type A sorting domain-containing protein, partial [Bacteroidota bacterium]
ISPDTLFLGSGNRVQLVNETAFTKSTSWDLGNGLLTNIENPSSVYDREGIYQIQLAVESVFGCTDVTTKELVVLNRNPVPEFNTLIDTLCAGQPFSLVALNSDSINVYADPEADVRISSGHGFSVSAVLEDTDFYITNVDGPYESDPVRYQLIVDDFEPSWLAVPDTINLSGNGVFLQSVDAGLRSDFSWTVAGEQLSTHFRLRYSLENASPGELEVSLTARNARGCLGEEASTLNLTESPQPVFANRMICAGDDLLISPSNGQYFSFYSSLDADEALYKGASFLMQNITTDTVVYLRGLDGYLEGEATRVEIFVEDFAVEILTSETEVELERQAVGVNFAADGNISNYNWYVNDRLVDTTPSPLLFFDSTGEYLIRLEALNESGCRAVAERQLIVVAPNVVTNVSNESSETVYPVPTRDLLFFPERVVAVEVMTISGQIMLQPELSGNQVSLKSLPNGMYVVKAFLREGTFSLHKVLVRK